MRARGGLMNREYGVAENAAAIAYGMKCLTNGAGLSFYERHCDELEGECGMLAYFVECATEFEDAEFDLSLRDVEPPDWYLAVDAFCLSLMSANEIPRDRELKALALAAITSAIPTPLGGPHA